MSHFTDILEIFSEAQGYAAVPYSPNDLPISEERATYRLGFNEGYGLRKKYKTAAEAYAARLVSNRASYARTKGSRPPRKPRNRSGEYQKQKDRRARIHAIGGEGLALLRAKQAEAKRRWRAKQKGQ